MTYLLDLINDQNTISEDIYSKIEVLESYVVEIRYPGGRHEPTEDETEEALNIAADITKYISDKIEL